MAAKCRNGLNFCFYERAQLPVGVLYTPSSRQAASLHYLLEFLPWDPS